EATTICVEAKVLTTKAGKRHRRLSLVLLWLLCFCVTALAQTTQTGTTQKRVVILYPTRPDAPVPAQMDPVYRKILSDGLQGQLDLHSDFIDLIRFPEPEYQTALHDFLASKYKHQPIDLVITIRTPPPNEFTTLFRNGLFRDVPVVYIQRDAERSDPNSTGVYYD